MGQDREAAIRLCFAQGPAVFICWGVWEMGMVWLELVEQAGREMGRTRQEFTVLNFIDITRVGLMQESGIFCHLTLR
jgi:hypothetical protein